MRVLWFTNTPSLSASRVNQKVLGGAWIESLENELSKLSHIHLGISYNVYDIDKEKFTLNNTVYYPVKKTRPKNKLIKIFEGWNHRSPVKINMKPYLDVINDFNPDLIHIFGTEGEFGLLSSLTDVPCLIYIQGILTPITQKWFSGFTFNEVFKYSPKWPLFNGRGLFHEYYKIRKAAWREEIIYKRSKFFIGRTDWDRRISSVFSPGSKYFHCDEIMRSAFYHNKWENKSSDSIINIISTTRNTIYKGLETVFEAAIYLKRFFPEYKLNWRVAGVRSNDEVALLIQRKYKEEIEVVGIRLLGPLNEEDLISEMLQADLFVHPSHIDNSPNSVCEAMLIGMPVIATYVGGIPDMLLNNKEGLLYQDGDSIALAGTIIELHKNRELSITLGEMARKKALLRNDPDKVTRKILEIYNEIIK